MGVDALNEWTFSNHDNDGCLYDLFHPIVLSRCHMTTGGDSKNHLVRVETLPGYQTKAIMSLSCERPGK